MSTLSRAKTAISQFHNDERGLEALQTVMILAIAAVALILVKNKWKDISGFFQTNMTEAIKKENWAQPK